MIDQKLFGRIAWIQVALILLGVAGWGIARGRLGLLSFGCGATIASAGLWVLHRVVLTLLGAKPNALAILLMTTRLLIAAVVLYVILNTYEVLPMAVALGVLTPVLAILGAILYEHFHARTP